MKKQHVLNCMFSNWYPVFKQHTMKSIVIPLADDFTSYLQDNGTLILPRGVEVRGEYSHEENCDDEWEESTSQNDDSRPDFPDLIEELSRCINDFGGCCFPKMGWSAPRDAGWINNNTLKCSSPGEVMLLLKSSDFISHDLTSVFERCEDLSNENHSSVKHELVLRKWANLMPGMEFRCFVRQGQLVAVSQRDYKQFYDFIQTDKEELANEIYDFVMDKIVPKFHDDNFVVDVYKKRNGNYWIIDFNTFCETTDSLLFSWDEIFNNEFVDSTASVNLTNHNDEIKGQFRYTDRTATLQPSEYLSHRMPVDFLHLSTGEDATKLIDFMRMKIQTGDGSSDESDDDETWKLPCER